MKKNKSVLAVTKIDETYADNIGEKIKELRRCLRKVTSPAIF